MKKRRRRRRRRRKRRRNKVNISKYLPDLISTFQP